MHHASDIAVLGSGPAALAIAAAAQAKGATVAVIAPDPFRAWVPNYCLWADELPAELDQVVERRWPKARVATPYGEHELDRGYIKLDTAALQAMRWDALRARGVRVVDASVRALSAREGGTDIQLEGASESARVVVDATGATSPFVKRVHGRPPAFQTAFGLLLDAPNHGFDADRVVLMDFRPAPGASEPSSFLYVLPLDGGRLFVEETVLARRPEVDLGVLEGRLMARLHRLGLDRCPRLAEEHCHIAMGLGLPAHRQRVVPFGAAASMVHPASGYLQARIFRYAPRVAYAIVEALRRGGPDEAIERGNEALWPAAARAAWELYTVGLESLVRMNVEQTSRFFDAFFRLPAPSWSGFLGGTLDPSSLRAVMAELFRALPIPLQWRLVRSSVIGGAAPLARAFLSEGAA